MNITACLTPDQIRGLDGSALRAVSLSEEQVFVGVSEQNSESGFLHQERDGGHYVFISPSRRETLREKGSVEGVSDTGRRIKVYSVYNQLSPNLF